MRFRAEEEPFAFALPDYEHFAQTLAEAAKRTLETPLEQKRKGKEYDDDDWDELRRRFDGGKHGERLPSGKFGKTGSSAMAAKSGGTKLSAAEGGGGWRQP